MSEQSRPEGDQAEVPKPEKPQKPELERRLTEAKPAEPGATAAGTTRSAGDAMRGRLGERAATSPGAESGPRTLERELLKKTEAVKPAEQQIQDAIKDLGKIRELRPEVWKGLNDAKRLEVIKNVEKQMAKIQGRPPAEVKVERMGPGQYGGYALGAGEMRISQAHLRSNDTAEILDTMVHEGRHAYQYHAATHPGFHPNRAEADAWKRNFQPGNYLRPEIVGQRAYERQPVEADARAYANKIVPKVMGGKK